MGILTIITPPTTLPISLVDAKAHLRVEDTYNDATITRLIAGVVSEVEEVVGQALAPQTLELFEAAPRARNRFLPLPTRYYGYGRYGGWHGYGYGNYVNPPIELPRGPIVSVEKVELLSDDYKSWSTVDAANYELIEGSVYCNDTWLRTYRVTYTAGYADATAIPPWLLDCMYALLAHRYDNEAGADIPKDILDRLSHNRVRGL